MCDCGGKEVRKDLSQPVYGMDDTGGLSTKHLMKVLLLGNSGVGKSSLIGQYCNNEFVEKYKATIGADFMTKEVRMGDHIITLQIWDTAGQERFHSLGVAFYRGADACILVYSLDDINSFKSLQKWKDEFLLQASPSNPSAFPFIVLGNKDDLPNDEKVVPFDKAIDWCHSGGNMPMFLSSAKNGTNINEAFDIIIKKTLALK